jgi:hypothetical protein
MSRRASAAKRATLVFAASLALAAGAATGAETAHGIVLKQAIGTVNAVDAEARRVAVVTGCGHALRVMVFQLDAESTVELGGAASRAADLRRGQIVEVWYRNAAPPYVAESIKVRSATDAGGPR